MSYDLAAMKARRTELIAQRDAVRAQSAPVRANRDAIEAAAKAQTDALDAEIHVIEAGLVPIKDELAKTDRAIKALEELEKAGA